MPISDYTPDLPGVGALLRARTVDAGGNEVGTFTPNTRPTDVEAQLIIDDAVNDAVTIFGEDIPDAPGNPASPGYDPDSLRKAAKSAVEFHAAAGVEISHFPEQVARGSSPYQQYEDQWTARSKRVAAAIDAAGGSPLGGTENNPVSNFPEDQGGMVGWGSRW